jgi:hypothetical protein
MNTLDQNEWKNWLEQQRIANDVVCCNDEEDKTEPCEIIVQLFGLTTYDTGIDRILGRKIIDALLMIAEKRVYDIIDTNYEAYLDLITVINFKKIEDMLNWGTSIRGCWFDFSDGAFEPIDNLTRFTDETYPVIKTAEEMHAFLKGADLFLGK